MNLMMILRLLYLVVILLGIAQALDWVGDPGFTNIWTWVHIIAGLGMIALIEVIGSRSGAGRRRL